MGVTAIGVPEVASGCVAGLLLDAQSVDLSSVEVLAEAIRRTASFRCPTTAGFLVRSVVDRLGSLVPREVDLPQVLNALVDAMVAGGDLLELQQAEERRRMLYLGPPAFVRRLAGSILIQGIRPEAAPLVGESLMPFVEYERHTRLIRAPADVDVQSLVVEYGLHEIPHELWLRCPRPATAEQLLAEADRRLDPATPSGEIPGVWIFDPTTPVSYYRGRWRQPRAADSGRFVARRPQAYGSDLWCYVELVRGDPVKLIDLPLGAGSRGCDEAWRLQAAIDAVLGHPQQVRIESASPSRDVISLFAPPPSWLQRRWDARGLPLAARGALASYALQPEETTVEVQFLEQMLWLEVAT